MSIIRSPLRSTLRSPLRGALESPFGATNPLSITAPGAYAFLDSDQPISLYDFEAHNLLEDNNDLTGGGWSSAGTPVLTANSVEDDNASGYESRFQVFTVTPGRTYEIYARVLKDAVATTTRFCAFHITDEHNHYFFFDTSDAVNNHGEAAGTAFEGGVSVEDDTTHWDIRLKVMPSLTTLGVGIFPAIGATATAMNVATLSDISVSAVGTLTFDTSPLIQVRDVSSPQTYVNTTAAVASYGDIQFADSEDDGSGEYTLTMTLSDSGTIDFDNTAYAALTENSGGDGTGAIDVTGTLAELNALFLPAAPALDNFATGTGRTIAMILTRDADGVSVSKTIDASSYAALDFNTLAPADNATDIAYNRSTFTATFDRAIQLGTGNIVLKLVGGATLETFNVATGTGDQGGTVTVSGADLIISPNVNLTDNTAHAIQIAATAIDGAEIGAGDSFAGIADDTTWSFTSEDTTPTLSSPLDSATGGTTATAAVTTDINHGTLYWIVDENTSTPSAAQVKAGQEQGGGAADADGSQAVTATGSQAIASITGLTSETAYKTYFMHESANGAQSTVSVADGFTTDDVTAPTVSTLSPADGATGVAIDANLVMTFDEGMARQGTVTLKSVGGATIETFDLSTDGTWSTVSETDDRWTGNPASDFSFEADLAVRWSGLEDTSGNALTDNATDTTWNFTSAAEVTYVAPEGVTSQSLGNTGGLALSVGTDTLTATASAWDWIATTVGAKEVGKYYVELDLTFSTINSTVWVYGVQDSFANAENSGGPLALNTGFNECAIHRSQSNSVVGVDGGNWSAVNNGPTHTYADGDVVQICIDITATDIDVWFGVNNSFTGTPASGTDPNSTRSSVPDDGVAIVLGIFGAGNAITLKTKASEQTYAAPSGFTAIDDVDQDTATWIPAGGNNVRPFGIIKGETGELGTARFTGWNPLTTGTEQYIPKTASINFVTDSQNITARAVQFNRGGGGGTFNGDYKADIIADGTVVDTIDFATSQSHARASLAYDFGSSTSREIEIVLPYDLSTALLGVETDSGSTNSPGTISRSSDVLWLGDSIVAGVGAGAASDVPSWLLSDDKGWNVVNLGVGSSVIAAAQGTTLGDIPADLYLVLSGYNDFASQTNPTTYEATLDSFLSNFQTANASGKMYFISPIGASNETGATYDLSEYRTAISNAVTTAGGNINYIAGTSILAYSAPNYNVDGIHPNSTGYAAMITALSALVSL